MKPLLISTRPAGLDSSLEALCKARQWGFLSMPGLEIRPDDQALAQLPEQILTRDVLFFVSPSAVKIATKVLDWCSINVTLVTVGQSTAKLLSQVSGQEVYCPEEGHDSEALLSLPIWQHPARLLIVRGQGGRNVLGERLLSMGWDIEYAGIYTRETLRPPPADIWTQVTQAQDMGRPVAVLATSKETIKAWLDAIPCDLQVRLNTLLYISIHPRIAAFLHEVGIKNVLTPALGDENIIKTLTDEWIRL